MFKQKLKALDYMLWDKVNGNNPQDYRNLVLWLEEEKIRHYTIDDRAALKEINNNQWDKHYEKYLSNLGCPITTSKIDQIEWLIGQAVRFEFDDDLSKYQQVKNDNTKNDIVPSIKSTNPLDKLNFNDNEFKNGVKTMSQLLKIGQHPNHLVTLEACSKYVTQRLNLTALKNPNSVIIKGKPFPITETEMGFEMNDKVLNNSAKALNLLYIQDLRNLQTNINETIVAVQNITANPKTDTRAGRVGI